MRLGSCGGPSPCVSAGWTLQSWAHALRGTVSGACIQIWRTVLMLAHGFSCHEADTNAPKPAQLLRGLLFVDAAGARLRS